MVELAHSEAMAVWVTAESGALRADSAALRVGSVAEPAEENPVLDRPDALVRWPQWPLAVPPQGIISQSFELSSPV